MRAVSYFDKATGQLADFKFWTTDDSLIAKNAPAGHAAIDGHYDHLSQRVDIASGKVVDYQPPRPSDDREWDDQKKRWVPSQAAQAALEMDRNARTRIAFLEQQCQPRAMRESLLCGGIGQAAQGLRQIDEEIGGLRKQLLPKEKKP